MTDSPLATYCPEPATRIQILPRLRVPSVQICCAVAAIVMLLVPLGSMAAQNSELLVWITAVALGALAVHGMVSARRAGENMWLAPVPILVGYFFLRYGCGALSTYYCEYFPWRVYPQLRVAQHRNGIWENLPAACHLILLFACGMYIGLSLRTDRVLRCLPQLQWPIALGKLKTNVVLYAPASLVFLTLVSGSSEGLMAGIGSILGTFTYPITVLATYWCFTARRYAARVGWATFVALTYILSLPAALKTGQMLPIVIPLVMIILGRLLAVGSPPWKLILVLAPLLVNFVIPFTAFYKVSKLPGRSLEERVQLAYERFKAADSIARLELLLERTVLRSSGVFLPAVFSQYFPRVYPFEWGRTFAIEASAAIPRFIWPDRPSVSTELNLYSVRTRILSEGHGSAVFDAISEYYINFGTLGVFLLSIVHGYYWKIMYDWLATRVHYVLGMSIFLYLCVMNEGFFGIGYIFFIHLKTLGVWLTLFYLLSRRSAPRQRRYIQAF